MTRWLAFIQKHPKLGVLFQALVLAMIALLALQIYFAARILMMRWVAPESTAFERSEAWRIAAEKNRWPAWSQSWRDYPQISVHLKRAVVASEDASFVEHDGVDWDAIEKAYEKNRKIEEAAAKQAQRLEAQANKNKTAKTASAAAPPPAPKPVKVVGGSTISQQLAKNLFLSGERNYARKAQELVLTFMLEALLDKRRILEIYLNHVEWGEGVFGAEAAARHYFKVGANQLNAYQAARLAVMLPRPKYFEKLPHSGYLAARAETITARMSGVELPD
jgi:monofunctional biosynthetic peptidoglycan transglycosylase